MEIVLGNGRKILISDVTQEEEVVLVSNLIEELANQPSLFKFKESDFKRTVKKKR